MITQTISKHGQQDHRIHQPSEMASLSNFRWKTRKERTNRSSNNGDNGRRLILKIFGGFSVNNGKWLPYQILGSNTLKNVQIDPQERREIANRYVFCE